MRAYTYNKPSKARKEVFWCTAELVPRVYPTVALATVRKLTGPVRTRILRRKHQSNFNVMSLPGLPRPWICQRCLRNIVRDARGLKKHRLLQSNYNAGFRRHASQESRPLRVAIVGSGPAGFYAASKLMQRVENVFVDMYEQLPAPFGLVRFGVAPDHPEVKSCQERFTEIAESPRFNFIGNVNLGHDLPLLLLQPHYDALLFAYGASKDKELGLPGEKKAKNIYSARAFVGWYNGLPEYKDLDPDLSLGEDAVIIGQGNVATDVARILLTDVDVLRKTDITDYSLQTLLKSRVKSVRIVGRRGPLQAAFTIKEVRELLQIPNVHFTPIPSDLFPVSIDTLPRPKKRLLQLLEKSSLSPVTARNHDPKSWGFDFLLSPESLGFSQVKENYIETIRFRRNKLREPLSITSGLESATHFDPLTLPAQSLFRSIGYKSEPIPGFDDLGVPFQERSGTIPNDGIGRIVAVHAGHEVLLAGLYCAGWVKRGPTGVIASTMEDAFVTAEAMADDWADGQNAGQFLNGNSRTCDGWEGVRREIEERRLPVRRVSWNDWKKIDAAEKERGRRAGKEREKFGSVEEMLEVLG
ncbi:MAG: hypothetical protein Q9227_001602 [Pyrenula ochraceoflavens]